MKKLIKKATTKKTLETFSCTCTGCPCTHCSPIPSHDIGVQSSANRQTVANMLGSMR